MSGLSCASELASKAGIRSVSDELQRRGLKVGGGLAQRAERLWACKDMGDDEIPAKWLSKARRRLLGRVGNRAAATASAAAALAAPKRKERPKPAQQPQARCPSPPVDGAAAKAAHPFDSDALDCAETSPAAYEDIAPLLSELARRVGKLPSELRIYDPYFCAGAVKRRLERVGFPKVRNACVDCYSEWASGSVPAFDVMVTNPPYSADHVRRLLAFAAASGRPWFCLMPSYVHLRPEWAEELGDSAAGGAGPERGGRRKRPRDDEAAAAGDTRAGVAPGSGCLGSVFFVAPRKRYTYFVPKGMQGDAGSANGKKRTNTGPRGAKTSPFPSMWYCCAGEGTADLVRWWRAEGEAAVASGSEERGRPPPVVTISLRGVPPSVLDPSDPLRGGKRARR